MIKIVSQFDAVAPRLSKSFDKKTMRLRNNFEDLKQYFFSHDQRDFRVEKTFERLKCHYDSIEQEDINEFCLTNAVSMIAIVCF